MSAGKVDVLGVMDRIVRMIDISDFHPDHPNDLREVRAAVAELIEADREYDAALEEWRVASTAAEYAAAERRRKESKDRRSAALAKVGAP